MRILSARVNPPCFMIATFATTFFAVSLHAQTFVYSGREYKRVGRSYGQLRTMDLKTGTQTQLTTSDRDHNTPWCSPDGSYILFTVPDEQWIFKFDRRTKTESREIPLTEELFAFVGMLESNRLLVQHRGGILEVLDLKTNRSVRKFPRLSSQGR